MLKAALVNNGVQGLRSFFGDNEQIHYTELPVTADFSPTLSLFDLLIVPNGSDHVAMAKIAGSVHDFLQAGGAVFCFDGWTTDWLPGFEWICDQSKPTAEVRYHAVSDPANLLAGVDIDQLIFNHGISGWWACGYMRIPELAHTVLADTWQRPVVAWDESSTPGIVFCTASGPLGDCGLDGDMGAIGVLYRNALTTLSHRLAAFKA